MIFARDSKICLNVARQCTRFQALSQNTIDIVREYIFLEPPDSIIEDTRTWKDIQLYRKNMNKEQEGSFLEIEAKWVSKWNASIHIFFKQNEL